MFEVVRQVRLIVEIVDERIWCKQVEIGSDLFRANVKQARLTCYDIYL